MGGAEARHRVSVGVTDETAIRIGVDENGLGPRLGPLVVTAVTATTTGTGHRTAESRPRGALRKRLDDSKRLVAYGDSALGEAWGRAIVRRSTADPESPAALVAALSLDSSDELRAPCPSRHLNQCWGTTDEAFMADAELVATVERDLGRLEAKGVRVEHAACVLVCSRRLNTELERGRTRFAVDLHAMERLVLDARARTGREVVATCGKVGGYDRYSSVFGPLAGRLHAIAGEGRARSEYAFPGLGHLAFVRDADAKHLLVCMASLVGKWVRDAMMARIVRYHRALAAPTELPDASGYHDPVTSRFIRETRLTRAARELPDTCFERRAWDDVHDGSPSRLTARPDKRAAPPSARRAATRRSP
jgi:ribonuclease HII